MTYQRFTDLSQFPDGLADELSHGYEAEILSDEAYSWIKQWAEPTVTFVEFDGGQWMSVVELFHHEIKVGDVPQWVAGISGVMTYPDYRGRGLAPKLISAALDYAREHYTVHHALLTCKLKMIPYYHKAGWQLLDCDISFAQEHGNVRFDPDKVAGMVYPFTDVLFPQGAIDMNGFPW